MSSCVADLLHHPSLITTHWFVETWTLGCLACGPRLWLSNWTPEVWEDAVFANNWRRLSARYSFTKCGLRFSRYLHRRQAGLWMPLSCEDPVNGMQGIVFMSTREVRSGTVFWQVSDYNEEYLQTRCHEFNFCRLRYLSEIWSSSIEHRALPSPHRMWFP